MGVTDLPERGVRRFDELQQQHWWLAHPIGAVRKYADDRGSALAGLVTFQVFLGMLPLLVVVLTVLGRLIDVSPEIRDAILESTIAQFPVIGSRIEDDIDTLAPDGIWIVASIAGLLWTATGIYHSMQLALNQVWNVEGVGRQGFVSRHLRALLLFALVILAALGTAFIRGRPLLPWRSAILLDIGSALISAVIAIGLLLAVFRIVVAPSIPTAHLVPAAVLGGLFWELLQRIGTWVVLDRLAEAEDLYGSIGFVVVALFWINLLARSAIFANEWAVVSWQGLWPRRIAQPPLTEADRRVLERLVLNERRRPEEHIDITWDERADTGPDDGADGDGAGDGGADERDPVPRRDTSGTDRG
jgi:YihY family inner membrane protein